MTFSTVMPSLRARGIAAASFCKAWSRVGKPSSTLTIRTDNLLLQRLKPQLFKAAHDVPEDAPPLIQITTGFAGLRFPPSIATRKHYQRASTESRAGADRMLRRVRTSLLCA